MEWRHDTRDGQFYVRWRFYGSLALQLLLVLSKGSQLRARAASVFLSVFLRCRGLSSLYLLLPRPSSCSFA